MRLKLAAAAVILSVSTVLAAPKYASMSEFTASIVGKTISSTTQKGVPFTAVIKAGGTGTFQQKGKKKVTFKWTFKDPTFCWDFGDFKECSKVEIVSATAANFFDDTTGKLNNAYKVK